MTNWGKPDFKPDPAVDVEASHLRMRLMAEGKMSEWPKKYPVKPGYERDLIQAYCVRNAAWQEVRLSMKGKTTDEKLAILEAWWEKNVTEDCSKEVKLRTEIQIGNYLGALRRGGQLDSQNRVRKYI